ARDIVRRRARPRPHDSSVKLRDLANRLHCRLEGDGDIEIAGMAGLTDAGPGQLTFLANPKYRPLVDATRASAVILHDDDAPAPCAMLRTTEPYRVFAEALVLFGPDERRAVGVHASAVVSPDARLGRDVSIG